MVHMKDYVYELVNIHKDGAIFFLLILEFLGFPIPGEPLMTFLGYLNRELGYYKVIISIIYAVLGTNIGSIVAYWLGYYLGSDILIKYGKYILIDEVKIEKTRKMFDKGEVPILLFNRYIPGVRHVVPYLAGIVKTNFWKYAFYSFIGSVIWCMSFILFGCYMGEKWMIIKNILNDRIELLVLITIILVVPSGLIFYKKYRQKKIPK